MKVLELVDFESNFINFTNSISFVLKSGNLLLLKGKNGSGKTTLIETFLGIHKPRNGYANFYTDDVALMSQKDIFNTNFPITVKDILKFSLYSRRKTSIFRIHKEMKRISEVIYRNLEIDNSILNKNVSTLSGGERQRLKMTLTILEWPKLLILDEPFNNTDSCSYTKIVNEIKYQKEILKTAIILVSHSIPKTIESSIDLILKIDTDSVLLIQPDKVCS